MYIIDSIKQYDGSTKVLAIDDNQLQVRSYSKGAKIPRSDESHLHAGDLAITKKGDTLRLGNFCEGTIVDGREIRFRKGSPELQDLVCKYTGYKNLKSKDFING